MTKEKKAIELFAAAVLRPVVTTWMTKNALNRLFNRDFDWKDAYFALSLVQFVGIYFELGRHSAADFQDKVDKLKADFDA